MDPKGFSAIAGLEVNTSYKIWDYMNQNLMTRVFRLFENFSIYRELLSEIWHPTTFLSSIRLFFAWTPHSLSSFSPSQYVKIARHSWTIPNGWRITGDLVTFLHIKRVGDEFQPPSSESAWRWGLGGWMGRGIKIPMGDEGNVSSDEHMVLEWKGIEASVPIN